jgi:hypothetical protein
MPRRCECMASSTVFCPKVLRALHWGRAPSRHTAEAEPGSYPRRRSIVSSGWAGLPGRGASSASLAAMGCNGPAENRGQNGNVALSTGVSRFRSNAWNSGLKSPSRMRRRTSAMSCGRGKCGRKGEGGREVWEKLHGHLGDLRATAVTRDTE